MYFELGFNRDRDLFFFQVANILKAGLPGLKQQRFKGHRCSQLLLSSVQDVAGVVAFMTLQVTLTAFQQAKRVGVSGVQWLNTVYSV